MEKAFGIPRRVAAAKGCACVLLTLIGNAAVAANDSSATRTVQSEVAFQSWVERRDSGLVRQAYDFSCGLAALATLMNWHGVSVTEAELLAELGDTWRTQQRRISFADLATLARRRGFLAQGVAVPTESLKGLRRPAIVALRTEGRDHFSVLRAVSPDGVALLADPTWGHRRMAEWTFRRALEGASASASRARVAGSIPTQTSASASAAAGRLLLVGRPVLEDEIPVPGVKDWRWPVRIQPMRP
ncbi:MAG: cysteine peptidase family C39 domain-containing protein [Pseudomonadota bacterium]